MKTHEEVVMAKMKDRLRLGAVLATLVAAPGGLAGQGVEDGRVPGDPGAGVVVEVPGVDGVSGGPVGWAPADGPGRTLADVPAAWLQEDPGDSLYRSAREALNRREYEAAARQFQAIRERHPRSGYVPDSYYFQALALQRAGGDERLRSALTLLRLQGERHAGAATRAEAEALEVRIQGVLAQAGDARAAAAVTSRAQSACEGGEQELRAVALNALLHMDADQAIPVLQEVLANRDECSVELRRRAVFLVSQKMGPETVDILLDLAHRRPDPDREVREQAVFWLSQVRSDEALAALESILSASDGDSELQEKAVFAVSQHNSPRSVQILRSYAERQDAPRELREQAIFWLGQSSRAGGPAYLRELYGRLQDTELKEKVIFGVAQARDAESRAWLLGRVRDGSEPVEIRKTALFWAGQSGGVDVAALRTLYGTLTDAEMKEQAIFVLSQRRGPEAVDALMEIVRGETDPELRERAVFWLGQSRDPRVAEFLLQLIRGGGE